MAGSINLYWVIGPALSVGGLAFLVEAVLARRRRTAPAAVPTAAPERLEAPPPTVTMAPTLSDAAPPAGPPVDAAVVRETPRGDPSPDTTAPVAIDPIPSVLSDRSAFLRPNPGRMPPASAVGISASPSSGFGDFTADLSHRPPTRPMVRTSKMSKAGRRAARAIDAANAREVLRAAAAKPPRAPGPILGAIEPRSSRASTIPSRPKQAPGLGFTAGVALRAVEDPVYVDHDYLDFVDGQWGKAGVDLRGYALVRHTEDGSRSYAMHSLVAPGYLNCRDGRDRKTFSSDARHRWTLDGSPVDPAAFKAMLRGVAPHIAFLPDPRPGTAAEAAEKDRHRTADRRILLLYRNADGSEAYRIISRPHRVDGGFTACCHFRYGERRNFRFDRAVSFANATTGEPLAPDAIFRGNRSRKPG